MRKSHPLSPAIQLTISIVLVLLGLSMAGCSSKPPEVNPITGLTDVISVRQAIDFLATHENAILLDVRTSSEWAQEGRSPDALLISLGDLPNRLDELDKDVPYIIIDYNSSRSNVAAQLMQEAGFSQVSEVRGGMRAWAAEGQPIECDRVFCGLTE